VTAGMLYTVEHESEGEVVRQKTEYELRVACFVIHIPYHTFGMGFYFPSSAFKSDAISLGWMPYGQVIINSPAGLSS
jgi:hypothetical protein